MSAVHAYAIRHASGAWLGRDGRLGPPWAMRMYSSSLKAESAIRQSKSPQIEACVVVPIEIRDVSPQGRRLYRGAEDTGG